MSTESNKALALEYLKRLEAGDFDAAFGMIADDGKVWVAGRTAPRDEFVKIVRSFRSLVVGPMTLKPVSAVAEGDRVAIEVEGGADMQKGVRYDNQYHFLFVIKDGKIVLLKEYMDTAAAQATWAGLGMTPPERNLR